MNPTVAGEQIALLLWSIGEGLWLLATQAWCREGGETTDARQLPRRLQRMEQRQILLRETRAGQIVYRLTATGRQYALGGRDPVACWNRPADGPWYQIVFDLPVSQQAARARLLRWLRLNGFGYLQDSVWIGRDWPAQANEALRLFRDDVEAMTVLEARCSAGYSDKALVNAAWKFDAINRRYEALITYVREQIASWRSRQGAKPTRGDVGRSLKTAHTRWLQAVKLDPLLPRALWPEGYAGEQALMALRELRDAAWAMLRLPRG